MHLKVLTLQPPGYTPFDRDTQQQEMEAILAGDYKFEPGTSPRAFSSALGTDTARRGVLGERLRYRARLRLGVPDDRPGIAANVRGGVAA